MVYTDVRNDSMLSPYSFIIFVKRLDFFTLPLTLYDSGLPIYNKLREIQKGFMTLINQYNVNSVYYIDVLDALKHYAKNTKIRHFKDHLLIYHSSTKPVCSLRSGHVFKVVSYRCNKDNYMYFHHNTNYTTLDTDCIKNLKSDYLDILKRIMYIDSTISSKQWQELEYIKRKNLRYKV